MTVGTLPTSHPAAAILPRARSLLDSLTQEGLVARALGGVAVAMRCPSAAPGGPLSRDYSDIDLAAARAKVKRFEAAASEAQFSPEGRFNAVNGRSRLKFIDPEGLHVDVFLDTFKMCHELPLEERLARDRETLTPADLLLTKLQVARINHKDVADAAALLLDHPLRSDESGLNVDYIAGILGRDWGWWRTVTENLAKVESHAAALPLPSPDVELIKERVGEMMAVVDRSPKSAKWRMRSRLGERVSWRLDPEDA